MVKPVVASTTTAGTDASQDLWKQRYRELCFESERERGEWEQRVRCVVEYLEKLSHAFDGCDGELDGALVDMRALLHNPERIRRGDEQIDATISRCLAVVAPQSDVATADPDIVLAQLLDAIELPAEHQVGLRILNDRVKKGDALGDVAVALAQTLNKIIAELAVQPSESAGSNASLATYFISLLDAIAVPAEMQDAAVALKQDLNKGGTVKELISRMVTFVDDLGDAARNSQQDLKDFLFAATGQLGSIERELVAELALRHEHSAARDALSDDISAEIDEMDAAVQREQNIDAVKHAIETRVQQIKGSLGDFFDIQRTQQADYDTRISELTTQVQRFEEEANRLRQSLTEQHEMAHRDAVTGIANRLAYEERVALEFHRSQRSNSPLSLAVLDLDHFKKINDTYGHRAGDKILRSIAELCFKRIRNTDLIARYGGEEFVLLFPDTELENATNVCDDIRRLIEKASFSYNGSRVRVTVSIGVTVLELAETIDECFERADQAVYSAKNAGRNRVEARQA